MKAMSNVDVYTISDELNNLLSGARVDKSFQPTNDIVVIRFRRQIGRASCRVRV